MPDQPRIELRHRPKTRAEVDRWLRGVLKQRAEALPVPTPKAAKTVAECDDAIDELLDLRSTLPEDTS